MVASLALLALLPLFAAANPIRRATGVQIMHNGNSNQVSDRPVTTARGVLNSLPLPVPNRHRQQRPRWLCGHFCTMR